MLAVLLGSSSGAGAAPGEETPLTPAVTERHVLPIFQARCVVCHGKRRQEGGLDLRTRESRLKGGESGPALVPGKPAESLLIRKIEAKEMPPVKLQLEHSVRPPTDAELETLRQWIRDGCPPGAEAREPETRRSRITGEDRAVWAFQPPRRPDPPRVEHEHLVRNPIDAFLLDELEAEGLSYSPEAEPLALLRRLYLDLTGMPPSPAEIRAYLEDRSPYAYERLVDRLLSSPEYGERWARHWLDLAGYSDSEGFGFTDNIRPYAWRYRDYVIRALNRDRPFDEFVTEQLAGDELVDHTKEEVTEELIDRLAATGFLRTVPDPTFEAEFAFLQERMNVVADEVEVVSSALLGLSMKCARCHDHKYEPISQHDYYRLSAILQTAYDPYDWLPPRERRLSLAPPAEKKEIEEFNAALEEKIEKLRATLETKAEPFRGQVLEKRLAGLPERLRELLETSEEDRSEAQKELAEKYAETLEITTEHLVDTFEAFAADAKPLIEEIEALEKKRRREPWVRVLLDTGGEPSTQYLLRRGDAFNPGEPVEPGVPAVLAAALDPYEVTPPWPGAKTSGRRLALARWLTQPDHPLTTRVLVNQLWLRHFGRALVTTPSNFGRSGATPSHPALLDWLATELVRSAWSLKAMHRLMVTSTAYRQSSRQDPGASAIDSSGTLLSRRPMRRMEAEQVYDSILKVAGRLDSTRFGPPQEVNVRESKEVVAAATEKGHRRSIYLLQRHTSPATLLDAFDLPERTPNCLERRESNVPTQALHMMNGSDVWSHSLHMAEEVIEEVGEDPADQINEAFLRAFARWPTRGEIEDCRLALDEFADHWRRASEEGAGEKDAGEVSDRASTRDGDAPEREARGRALASLCHTLLNSAEFLFID